MQFNPSHTRRCLLAVAFAASVSASQAATIFATLTSQDLITGVRQGTGPALGYQEDPGNLRAGVGGSSGNRASANTVIGFTLPTLNPGETINAATFSITVTSGSTGNAYNVALFGLATTNPNTGDTTDPIDFFSQSSTGAINATFTSNLAGAGSTPSTNVLTFINSFYTGGGTPSQSEVFFRLNQDEVLSLTTLDRVTFTINTAALSLNVIPEPSTALLGALGMLVLIRRKR